MVVGAPPAGKTPEIVPGSADTAAISADRARDALEMVRVRSILLETQEKERNPKSKTTNVELITVP
jgi:hypothetical protein